MGTLVTAFLITVVVVFGLMFFIFKIVNKSKSPLRNRYYWITSIVAVPLLLVGTIYFNYKSNASFKAQEFDMQKWMANSDKRYLLVDDLIEDEKLIGLTVKQVEALLGEVEQETDSGLYYYIGYNPKTFMNMAPEFLVITISEGKVTEVQVQD